MVGESQTNKEYSNLHKAFREYTILWVHKVYKRAWMPWWMPS